ncbi:hypothetical protein AU509_07345 [Lonsdalea britannica]|uniref:Morphogenetic protein n=1 Tax=Lonsdalea britannica TaxID=1082704 RepID=A0AAD0SHK6_9GAMM|nr:hypothetical protein [Lonsdalea britannica]AXW87781.1 hypothetical protein CKQ53_12920 [Lonsdalea britannica]OSM98328.1 hypothetical protein AU509_07345 [Lonsdalea britannica]
MKERGMIFNAEMVRAILDGRKTQTRRPVQFKPRDPGLNLNSSGLELGHYRSGVPLSGCVLRSRGGMGCWNDRTYPAKCPFGQPGDRIWVRETFNGFWLDDDVIQEIKDGTSLASELCDYRADFPDGSKPAEGWTPSIHMPRWASRITLEITGVRVERLRDISQEDANAEGMYLSGWRPSYSDPDSGGEVATPYDNFAALWESIYGPDSWQANPWVWVIEFREVK